MSVAIFSICDSSIPQYLLCKENNDEINRRYSEEATKYFANSTQKVSNGYRGLLQLLMIKPNADVTQHDVSYFWKFPSVFSVSVGVVLQLLTVCSTC